MGEKKLRMKQQKCGCCAGIVWGSEPPGAECPRCKGMGVYFITEHDRILDYPGGPFNGSWPGRFKELEEEGVEDYDWKPTPTKDDLWEMYCEAAFNLENTQAQLKAAEKVMDDGERLENVIGLECFEGGLCPLKGRCKSDPMLHRYCIQTSEKRKAYRAKYGEGE